MGNHEKFTITTTFIVCNGLRDKCLDEIKELIGHTNNSLPHAFDLKIKVEHQPDVTNVTDV